MEMLGELVLSRAPLDAVRAGCCAGSSCGLMPACFAEPQKAVSPHVASIPIELSEQELPGAPNTDPASGSTRWCHPAVSWPAGGGTWGFGGLEIMAGSLGGLGWDRDRAQTCMAQVPASPSAFCPPQAWDGHKAPAAAPSCRDSLGSKHRLRQDLGLGPRCWRKEAGEFEGGNKSQLLLKKDISCRSGCAGEGKGHCVVTVGRAGAGTGSDAAQDCHRGNGRPLALARLGTQQHRGKGWR